MESKDSNYNESKDISSSSKETSFSLNNEVKAESKSSSLTCDPKEIIGKVQEYFFLDKSLSDEFEKFVEERAYIVDLNSDEMKLSYTDAFNDFQLLFEKRLTSFIENELHSTITIFYNTLREMMDNDPDSSEGFFGLILLSIIDFDTFLMMLRQKAQEMCCK